MQPMDVIELSGVSKKYNLYDAPGDRLREFLSPRRRQYHREHWAIRDVSVKIRKGETFCIVGENGSGKSTLLKLMVGILQPTSGAVEIRGRVTALLELGSGFNPEFTGRQNVFLNGAILGLPAREVAAKLNEILEFAEIGAYIDQPVKTYSSGMVVRLAFAVAVHLDPDILIVDEALAVGDIYFRASWIKSWNSRRSGPPSTSRSRRTRAAWWCGWRSRWRCIWTPTFSSWTRPWPWATFTSGNAACARSTNCARAASPSFMLRTTC